MRMAELIKAKVGSAWELDSELDFEVLGQDVDEGGVRTYRIDSRDWTGGLPRQWAYPSASIPSGPVSPASPIQSASLRRRRGCWRRNASPAGAEGGAGSSTSLGVLGVQGGARSRCATGADCRSLRSVRSSSQRGRRTCDCRNSARRFPCKGQFR